MNDKQLCKCGHYEDEHINGLACMHQTETPDTIFEYDCPCEQFEPAQPADEIKLPHLGLSCPPDRDPHKPCVKIFTVKCSDCIGEWLNCEANPNMCKKYPVTMRLTKEEEELILRMRGQFFQEASHE